MSSFEFEPASHHLTVRPDFEGTEAKARAVFLADLFSPGGTNPGDLAPHSGESVDFQIAGDVNPNAIQMVCRVAGIEVDYRL